jgi:hypothetical protein
VVKKVIWKGDGIGLALIQREGEASRPSRNNDEAGRCPECGRRAQLYNDAEDGCAKCYHCCDMPDGEYDG